MASKDEERASSAEEEEREDSDSATGEGSDEGGDDAGDSDEVEGEGDAGDSDEDEGGDDAGDSDEDEDEGEEEEEDAPGDSDQDEDEEPEEAAAAEPKRGRRRARGRGAADLSPGARLAAAKARKARRKQAKRGKDAEVVESAVLKKADKATEWAQENRRTLWIALAAVAAIIIGTVVWNQQSSAREAEASAALWEAVEAARAEIRPEGSLDDPSGDDERETFPDVQTRAETALDRFRGVVSDYAGTDPAAWARLGEAGALMELGHNEEAREAYQNALSERGDDPMIAWRAIEGIAFTHEGDESWDQALARFQELGDSGEGELRDIADYHIARVHLAQGDEVRAKELLRGLVERLRGAREEAGPELSYVLSQAEIRLMEIDSSFAQQRPTTPSFGGLPGPGIGGGGGDPSEQLSPEQMQKLLKMLEERGMGGEPGGGAGGEGE